VGAGAPQGGEKIVGVIYSGKAEQEVIFERQVFCWAGRVGKWKWVILAVVAGVLRTTTKKVVNFFGGKAHPRKNPGLRAYMLNLEWSGRIP